MHVNCVPCRAKKDYSPNNLIEVNQTEAGKVAFDYASGIKTKKHQRPNARASNAQHGQARNEAEPVSDEKNRYANDARPSAQSRTDGNRRNIDPGQGDCATEDKKSDKQTTSGCFS